MQMPFAILCGMKPRTLAVILLAAAVLAGWYLFTNTAERQIRKLFDQVSSEMRKDGPEQPFAELAKAKALARHVGARLRIEGLGGRRDLALDHENLPQQIALFRRELQTFSVTFDQLTVTIANDGTAQAFCNATCSDLPNWVDDSRAYSLTASLVKNASGDWQFAVLHFAPLVP